MWKVVERLTWRHILAICFLSALARVGFLLLAEPPIPVAEDYAIARHIAAGDGFSIYERGPTSIKGPLYPTYLAALLWVLGEQNGLRAAILVQHLLYAAMPALLFQLGRAIAGQRSAQSPRCSLHSTRRISTTRQLQKTPRGLL